MQFRIPFTDVSLRMDLGKTDGKWMGADEAFGIAGTGTVTEEKALSIDAVYACVNLYARTVASLPLILYEKGGNGKVRAVNHPLYYCAA